MARVFIVDGREFPDPDPTGKLPVEDVRKLMTEFLPELTNADTREEKRGDDTVYTFTKRIGTKGGARRAPSVVSIVRGVPAKHLAVFDLAAELVDARGELDVDAAGARRPEVNLAVAEAEAYARFTGQAVEALLRLPPR
jgi:PRTRC genetic system protein C